MCAFDLPDGAARDALRRIAYDEGLLVLACGSRSIRLRPALSITQADVDEGLRILRSSLKRLAARDHHGDRP
jgi:L-lysine 6-transaminase